MKVLCICEHGNIRSVALAYLIKTIYKHEAIAIGRKNTSRETRDMLKEWADRVIDVEKLVGEDIWHDARHPDLLHTLLKHIEELNL